MEKSASAALLSRFSFEKYGSSQHFKIDDHKDLEEVLELDEALWIATTAPVSTLKADPVFLALLDSDQDGRLRAEEVKDGIRFLLRHLSDHSGIRPGNLDLPLSAVNKEAELGSRIHTSAMKALKHLQAAPDRINLAQVRKVKEEVLQGGLDQAGIVLPEAAENEKSARCIEDILRSIGGKTHPNDAVGIDRESLGTFFKECRLYLDWLLEADKD